MALLLVVLALPSIFLLLTRSVAVAGIVRPDIAQRSCLLLSLAVAFEAARCSWHWQPERSLGECAWAEQTRSAYATPVRGAPSGPEWERYDER